MYLLSVCVAKDDFQGGQEEDQGLRGQERAGQGISGQRALPYLQPLLSKPWFVAAFSHRAAVMIAVRVIILLSSLLHLPHTGPLMVVFYCMLHPPPHPLFLRPGLACHGFTTWFRPLMLFQSVLRGRKDRLQADSLDEELYDDDGADLSTDDDLFG